MFAEISSRLRQGNNPSDRSSKIMESFKTNSILSGTARDDIESFIDTQLSKDLADYAGGSDGFYDFVTDKDKRNEFFRDQAQRYYKGDKTGDPMARLLNALYGRGDIESIDRVADVLAERLRPRVSKIQAERDLLQAKESLPKPPEPVTLDKSANITQAGQDIRKRRGASLLSSIYAGETGNVSGRNNKSNGYQRESMLGQQKDLLGV